MRFNAVCLKVRYTGRLRLLQLQSVINSSGRISADAMYGEYRVEVHPELRISYNISGSVIAHSEAVESIPR